MEMIKRRIVTVVVVPSRERSKCGDTPGSDIEDHPDHVADTRSKADHDHRQKHQVPEGRVRLFAIELHDVDSREEDDEPERVHDKRSNGHLDQARPDHMLFDIMDCRVEGKPVTGGTGVQHAARR